MTFRNRRSRRRNAAVRFDASATLDGARCTHGDVPSFRQLRHNFPDRDVAAVCCWQLSLAQKQIIEADGFVRRYYIKRFQQLAYIYFYFFGLESF